MGIVPTVASDSDARVRSMSNVADALSGEITIGNVWWTVQSATPGTTRMTFVENTTSNILLDLYAPETNWNSPPYPINNKIGGGIRVKTLGAGKVWFTYPAHGMQEWQMS